MKPRANEVAGRLIAELEAEAELVDPHGEFSIDQAKAREKLTAYQLADPDAWVLVLVEFAALLGAKAVYFDYTEPERTQIRFRARSLGREQLAEPLNGVFAAAPSGDDPVERAGQRAWAKLAVVCNALLRRAKRIELVWLDAAGKGLRTCWAGPAGSSRFELDELMRDTEQAGNTMIVEFADHDRSHAERETALLRRACRTSSLLIMAGSEKLSHGCKAMFERGPERTSEPTTQSIRDDDFRLLGLAARIGTRTKPRLRIQTNGVFAEDIDLDGYPSGFVAIVDLDLSRDLAQNLVLRDAAFERMLGFVRATRDQMSDR